MKSTSLGRRRVTLAVLHEESTSVRYTDSLPPQDAIEARPNWVHAYGEEGRSNQDETTLRPQGRDDAIDTNTDYTVGDVWFENGDSLVALMKVSGSRIRHIAIYDENRIWTVAYTITRAERERLENLTFEERMKAPATKWEWACTDENDAGRLPIRYCTRLDLVSTGMPIKGKIFRDGTETDWDYASDPI